MVTIPITTSNIIAGIFNSKQAKLEKGPVPAMDPNYFKEEQLKSDLKEFKLKQMKKLFALNQDNKDDPPQLAMFNYFENKSESMEKTQDSFKDQQVMVRVSRCI